MTTTHRIAAALAAVALTACAHANTNVSSATAPSYLGGRAGQPGSWNVSAETASTEAARRQHWSEPAFGGRSAQPYSWISTDGQNPTSAAPSYCYSGGRDGQPFSGPALISHRKAKSQPTPVCERSGAQATRL